MGVAQATGQRKDRHGRWCVGLRWYASPAVADAKAGTSTIRLSSVARSYVPALRARAG